MTTRNFWDQSEWERGYNECSKKMKSEIDELKAQNKELRRRMRLLMGDVDRWKKRANTLW